MLAEFLRAQGAARPRRPARSHQLADFDSLVEAITDDKIASDPEVYVAQGSIVALLDRSDRRARVSVALATSHRFAVCEKLETPARLTPKDAVRLLKLELRRARDWRASVDGKVSWLELVVSRVHVSAARPDRRPKADSGKEPKP